MKLLRVTSVGKFLLSELFKPAGILQIREGVSNMCSIVWDIDGTDTVQ